MNCSGKHDTTWNILRSITFSLLHFMLYRGKSISFGTVYALCCILLIVNNSTRLLSNLVFPLFCHGMSSHKHSVSHLTLGGSWIKSQRFTSSATFYVCSVHICYYFSKKCQQYTVQMANNCRHFLNRYCNK